ncbi:MAG: hypothetical protein Pyrs2KO_15410 [Pyruvatibacter sp.]
MQVLLWAPETIETEVEGQRAGLLQVQAGLVEPFVSAFRPV